MYIVLNGNEKGNTLEIWCLGWKSYKSPKGKKKVRSLQMGAISSTCIRNIFILKIRLATLHKMLVISEFVSIIKNNDFQLLLKHSRAFPIISRYSNSQNRN